MRLRPSECIFLAVLGVVALPSCKARDDLASTKAAGAADDSDELGASDLSILVPLQPVPRTNIALSPFGKGGTGMCNAPGLDLGGADPIMSRAMWQDWAKDVLLSVLPLPPDDAAWDGPKPAVAALRAKMIALNDVDTAGACPDPVAGDALIEDVGILRQAGTNVATQQTLPAGACRYSHWHIVSARFEPCSFRPKVLDDDPAALDPAHASALPAEACGGGEFRLVAQPIVPTAAGYRGLDLAIHLFYKVEDPAAVVESLRSLRRATRAALAEMTAEGSAAVWYADERDELIPHPGLREEMDCGGHPLGDGPPTALGPVGTEFRRLLTTYAKQSKLFKATWLTSDNSGGNWSFGLRLVQLLGGSRRLTRTESFGVETFTASQFNSGFPYTPFDPGLTTVDYFFHNGRSDAVLTDDTGRNGVRELIDLANPDKTTFNLGGKFGASCASCHTRDQTERAVRQRTGKTHEQLAALGGTSTWTVPLWEPFRQVIEERNVNNVRNFGYGPAMTFGVSRRTVNETEAVRLVVKGFFGPAAAGTGAAGTAASPVSSGPAAATGPVDFQTDILPLMALRCGYCHGTKRTPALLQQADAESFISQIVEMTDSPPLSYRHMPPGKVLPKRELDLLHRWADQPPPAAAASAAGGGNSGTDTAP